MEKQKFILKFETEGASYYLKRINKVTHYNNKFNIVLTGDPLKAASFLKKETIDKYMEDISKHVSNKITYISKKELEIFKLNKETVHMLPYGTKQRIKEKVKYMESTGEEINFDLRESIKNKEWKNLRTARNLLHKLFEDEKELSLMTRVNLNLYSEFRMVASDYKVEVRLEKLKRLKS